jgi:hypothetical protein
MKTYDAQIITVRQINALNNNNSVIDANRVLTTDGTGGTYWAVPSGSGSIGALNEVVVDNKSILCDSSYNRLYIETAQGMGSVVNPITKLITLYSKGFDTIDISGGNTIYSSSNSDVSPTFKLVGRNGIRITSDPLRKEIFIEGHATTVTSETSGIYGYNQFNIIRNSKTIDEDTINIQKESLTATSERSVVSFAGIGDVLLSTNITQNIVFVSISTFTSRGYNDLSGVAYGTFSSCMSTVSSLFADHSTISTLSNSFTSSLVSTVKTLESKIKDNADYVQNNYTKIEPFKLLSTSVSDNNTETYAANKAFNRGLISTVSFASTLNVDEYIGTLSNIENSGSLEYIVSSASFRLDSMSSLLNKNAQVSLSFSPSLKFNFNMVDDTLFYVSTLIMCGSSNTSFPITTFVRPWLVYSGTSVPPKLHLYTDTINTTFNSEMVNNISLTSSYTFLHRITNYTPRPTEYTDFLVSGNNTLSILLTGTNFRSIN